MAATSPEVKLGQLRKGSTYIGPAKENTSGNEDFDQENGNYIGRFGSFQTKPQRQDVREPIVDEDRLQVQQPAQVKLSENSLEGSIVQVLKDHVEITCDIEPEPVTLHLPISLVPEELHIYGTPILLTMSDRGGRRTPKVTRRIVGELEHTDEEKEALAWLEEKMG